MRVAKKRAAEMRERLDKASEIKAELEKILGIEPEQENLWDFVQDISDLLADRAEYVKQAALVVDLMNDIFDCHDDPIVLEKITRVETILKVFSCE